MTPFDRFRRYLRGLWGNPEPMPMEYVPTADHAGGASTEGGYDPEQAMSAFAAFPWVFTAVKRRATAISGLPFKVYRDTPGGRVDLLDHPIYDLLDRPNSQTTKTVWLTQWFVDYDLAGNGWQVVIFDARGVPASLHRLAPDYTQVRASVAGGVGAIIHDGRVEYRPEDVLWLRGPAWQGDVDGLVGTTPIWPLTRALKAEKSALDFTERSSERGRFDAVISPRDGQMPLTPTQMTGIRQNYEEMARRGGLLIVQNSMQLEPLSFTPRDMEFQNLRETNRQEVLSVFGVPPTVAGLPGANYATAQQEARLFWGIIQAESALLCEQLTRLARMFPDSVDVVVEQDFSGVDALQESRSERLARVVQWMSIGADPIRAAESEGFSGDIFGDVSDDLEDDAPTRASDDGSPAMRLRVVGGDDDWWADAVTEMVPAPMSETDRAEAWRAWAKAQHTPAEFRLQARLRVFLRAQGLRMAARLAEEAPPSARMVKALDESGLERVLDINGEIAKLRVALGPLLRVILAGGFSAVADDIGAGLTFVGRAEVLARLIDSVCRDITRSTAENVRSIITRGLESGGTIGEIQEALVRSEWFSPMRALRIARTEATRAISTGQTAAYQEAQGMGIRVRRMWLSARDGEVREAHAEMDGQIVDVGEEFTAPSGEKALGPAQFSDPSLSVNCRCTTIPVVEGVA